MWKPRRTWAVALLGSVSVLSAPVAVHAGDGGAGLPLSKRILRMQAIVHADPAEVWHAWTTSEGIATFFSKESSIELRIGGPYELYMSSAAPDSTGKRGTQGCKVLSYIPQRMLAFEWNFPPKVKALRESGAKTQVVLRFDDLGDGRVRVRFAQLGWQDGEDWQAGYDYFDAAWSWVLSEFEKKYDAKPSTDRKPAGDRRRGSDIQKCWVDGHVNVTAVYGAQQSQRFEMDIPVPVEDFWNAIATEGGFRMMGAKEPKIELRPGGAYEFWPNAPNKVLAFVPGEMLSTSGSAPPEFPNVRKGGTWSAYELEAKGSDSTRLVLTCVGWRPGEKEWDDAFEYFLKANAAFLNQMYEKLVGARRSGTDDVLEQKIVVDAPVEAVWAAMTTAEGLKSWMVPHAEIDLRVGGLMRTNYDPKGTIGDEKTIENTILSFDPQRMLSIKATKAPKGFPFPDAIESTWSVLYFSPVGKDRTRVVCRGLGYGDDEDSMELRSFFTEGNEWTLNKLAERFAKPGADRGEVASGAGTPAN